MLYFHADHLGGTNVVTDESGNQVERTKYYPFGDIREGGNERYSFTGKEKDKATDFYYFEARHYNPGYRHFTQADIIVPNAYDPQSLNRYAYVKNNPLKYIDPTGNDENEFVWWKPWTWFKSRTIVVYNSSNQNNQQSSNSSQNTESSQSQEDSENKLSQPLRELLKNNLPLCRLNNYVP